MRQMGMMGMGPLMSDSSSVQISRAENGYMVTLYPPTQFEAMGMPFMMEKPEPHQIQEVKTAHEKSKPRVFVFASIEDAWDAVKGFLLDGHMPTQKT